MEELGFSIAVPETLLIGFAITIALVVVVLMKVQKIASRSEDLYYEMEEMSNRLKIMEKTVEKLEGKR